MCCIVVGWLVMSNSGRFFGMCFPVVLRVCRVSACQNVLYSAIVVSYIYFVKSLTMRHTNILHVLSSKIRFVISPYTLHTWLISFTWSSPWFECESVKEELLVGLKVWEPAIAFTLLAVGTRIILLLLASPYSSVRPRYTSSSCDPEVWVWGLALSRDISYRDDLLLCFTCMLWAKDRLCDRALSFKQHKKSEKSSQYTLPWTHGSTQTAQWVPQARLESDSVHWDLLFFHSLLVFLICFCVLPKKMRTKLEKSKFTT